MESRVPDEPLLDLVSFVGGVAVQGQTQVQLFRDRGVGQLQESEEFLVAVPAVVLGDDRVAGEVEGAVRRTAERPRIPTSKRSTDWGGHVSGRTWPAHG